MSRSNGPQRQLEESVALEEYLLRLDLSRILSALDVTCVVDVGANVGQYGRSLRRLGYTGRIVSFEPVSVAYEALVREADRDAEWRTICAALGRQEGTATINVSQAAVFSSFLDTNDYARSRFGLAAASARTERVPVRRLDDLWDRVVHGLDDPKVFLKMDTQGFDLEAFAGSEGVQESIVGIQSEISVIPIYDGMPDIIESISVYRASGFEIASMHPVSRDPLTQAVIEFDCLLVRSA